MPSRQRGLAEENIRLKTETHAYSGLEKHYVASTCMQLNFGQALKASAPNTCLKIDPDQRLEQGTLKA